MSLNQCHRTRKRLSTHIFDIMKLEILIHLNCNSPKYIAKLINLSISIIIYEAQTTRQVPNGAHVNYKYTQTKK